MLEVVVSLRACAWSLDLGQVVCAGGIHRARPLAALPAQLPAQLPAALLAALPAALLAALPAAPVAVLPAVLWVAAHDSRPASYPTNVACNSPDTVSHRAIILLGLQRLWTLLKVHSIELHAKLLRGCALARTWDQHLARGSDTSRVGPVVCVWAAPPRLYLGVGVRVTGLTRMFSGSRASGAPGQAPLCSRRRSPCPRHAIVGVCGRGGLYCGRHAASKRDLTVPNCDLTAIKWVELRYTGAHA